MRIIRARRDDWIPRNPAIRPASWVGGFLVVAVIYVAVAATIGSLLNGNGSPFLLGL
jgi:hypothetical protein